MYGFISKPFLARSTKEKYFPLSQAHLSFFFCTVGKIIIHKKGHILNTKQKKKLKFTSGWKIFLQTILNYFYEDDYVVKKKSGMEWTLFTYFSEVFEI